jgi:ABC-type antimicrobial peptide transport system permease subunit
MPRALLISAVIAVVIGVGFYLFFRIHQELDFPPAYAWGLGLIAFVVSLIAVIAYSRNRSGR